MNRYIRTGNLLGILFLACLVIQTAHSQQNPNIVWSKSYGGSELDDAFKILHTTNGNLLVGGRTNSSDKDVRNNYGTPDIWLVMLNNIGDTLWERNYGGSGGDALNSMKETLDHGFIFCGTTISNDSDVSGNHFWFDGWVVKLDSSGNIQWQRCYGGNAQYEGLSDIVCLKDTTYVLIGNSSSTDGDLANVNHHGYSDFWLLKINSKDSIIWSKTYGGTGGDDGYAVSYTNDGGFILAGITTKGDGDVINSNYHGSYDYWVLKVDSEAGIQWSKCYGGSSLDEAHTVIQLNDGGYVISGTSWSKNGDVTNHHGITGNYDYWIVKTDSAGNIEWQRSLGGTEDEDCWRIIETTDHGILISGSTRSHDGDVTFNHSAQADAWLVKLDQEGNLLWQYSYGGSDADIAYDVVQLNDGAFVFAGLSDSDDGDVTLNNGMADYWIVKLSPYTAISNPTVAYGYSIYPNPTSTTLFFQNNDAAPGTIELKDALGRLLCHHVYGSIQRVEIDVSTYPKGIYFLLVKSENGIKETKVVVQ